MATPSSPRRWLRIECRLRKAAGAAVCLKRGDPRAVARSSSPTWKFPRSWLEVWRAPATPAENYEPAPRGCDAPCLPSPQTPADRRGVASFVREQRPNDTCIGSRRRFLASRPGATSMSRGGAPHRPATGFLAASWPHSVTKLRVCKGQPPTPSGAWRRPPPTAGTAVVPPAVGKKDGARARLSVRRCRTEPRVRGRLCVARPVLLRRPLRASPAALCGVVNF
jgi:hypothetical protein